MADLKELKSQAEITERKAGIKEVVDWVNHHLVYVALEYDGTPALHLQTNAHRSADEWQAKTEQSKAEQELKEKIEETIFDWQFRAKITSSLASRILALIKEAGYVKLIPDPLEGTPDIDDIAEFVDSALENQ